MLIDLASAKNLELVTNVVSKRSSHSLFGYVIDHRGCSPRLTRSIRLLNHTHTPMGGRLLRATILAPMTCTTLLTVGGLRSIHSEPAAQDAIEARLDVVEGMLPLRGVIRACSASLQSLFKMRIASPL